MNTEVCTNTRPKCLSVAPGNFSNYYTAFNLSTPWCNDGNTINKWTYHFNTCEPSHIIQHAGEQYLACLCSNDLWEACTPFYHDNTTCSTIFITIALLQTIIVTLATILNIIIVINFFRRRSLRKSIPNVLLFNQAVTDLVNILTYAMPNLVAFLYMTVNKKQLSYPEYHWETPIVTLIFTVSSSVFMFTIIGTERWLSVCKPLWRRVHVRNKHVWASVVIVWSLSLMLTVAALIVASLRSVTEILKASLAVLLPYITFLFILTFIQASKSIQSRLRGSGVIAARAKKQFRLTCVFFTMFSVFIVGFIPILLSSLISGKTYLFGGEGQILLTLFILSSALNPLLTLCLKRDFRLSNILQPAYAVENVLPIRRIAEPF